MILLTLVTVASLQTVGIILVVAMLITPTATHLFINRSTMDHDFFISWSGVLSSLVGLYVSFRYNLASGATSICSNNIIPNSSTIFTKTRNY